MLARKMLLVVATLFPALAYASSYAGPSGETSGPSRGHGRHVLRARTTWDSVFTTAQAARGETTYARTCSRCHGPALGGADEAPALTGGAFTGGWNGQTLADLHERVRTTMPTDTPGTYQRKDITDVIAYVLSFNRFPAGTTELSSEADSLKAITFVATKP